MDSLISLSIQENILIAHEIIHSMSKKKGHHELILIKADISKAYDKASWDFLRILLVNFDFRNTLIEWVIQCVSTASVDILLNEKSCGLFTPS